MNTEEKTWNAVFVQDLPNPTIAYRSGLVVYEESLVLGRLVGRSWNAAGFINSWDLGTRLEPSNHPTPQAFWLEIDGQLLASHWTWEGFEQNKETKGLHIVLTLCHKVRSIKVEVHTLLDGTSVLTRWLEVKNEGTLPASLGAIFPWSGILQTTIHWRTKLSANEDSLYSLGYMENPHWGNEGDF